MRALLIALFGILTFTSCEGLVENDCVCTTKSGEQYEEYDVEGACFLLGGDDASCKAK